MIGECSVSASDWQKPPRITDGRRHAIGPGDPENHRDVQLACNDLQLLLSLRYTRITFDTAVSPPRLQPSDMTMIMITITTSRQVLLPHSTAFINATACLTPCDSSRRGVRRGAVSEPQAFSTLVHGIAT